MIIKWAKIYIHPIRVESTATGEIKHFNGGIIFLHRNSLKCGKKMIVVAIHLTFDFPFC